LKGFWRFVCVLYQRTVYEDNCSSLAASISFYAILSFLPLIILAVSVFSFFVASSETAFEKIHSFLGQILPVSTGASLNLLTSTLANKTVFGILGLLGLLWAGMRIFSVLEYAMNQIWKPGSQRGFWHSKFVSLISVPFMTVFILVSIAATGLVSVARSTTVPYLNFSFNDLPFAANIITFLVPATISAILFLSIYYLLPKRWDHLKNALYGAMLAGVLWEFAKLLFDYYIKHFSHLQTLYGSFTSLAILFLWVYYSSFVILLGAEFGSLLHQRSRSD